MSLKDKEFFSIGDSCEVAEVLRDNKLRTPGPVDWCEQGLSFDQLICALFTGELYEALRDHKFGFHYSLSPDTGDERFPNEIIWKIAHFQGLNWIHEDLINNNHDELFKVKQRAFDILYKFQNNPNVFFVYHTYYPDQRYYYLKEAKKFISEYMNIDFRRFIFISDTALDRDKYLKPYVDDDRILVFPEINDYYQKGEFVSKKFGEELEKLFK